MTRILALMIGFFVTFALLSGAFEFGRADAGATEGRYALVAQVDTGSAAPAPAPTRADQLHDPLDSPQATYDDLKQAKRQGWAVLAFAIGVLVARLLGRAKAIPWLAWLGKGRAAILVGGFSALVIAGYNAIADGGSPLAALFAGAVAVAAWWPTHAQPSKQPEPEPAKA